MKNLKIKFKLFLGFGLILLLTIFIGLTGIFGVTTLDRVSTSLYKDKIKSIINITTSLDCIQQIRVKARDLILFLDNEDRIQTTINDTQQMISAFESNMATYKPTIGNREAELAFMQAMTAYTDQLKPAIIKLFTLTQSGTDQATLLNTMNSLSSTTEEILQCLNICVSSRVDTIGNSASSNHETSSRILLWIIITVCISTIIAVIIAVYISGKIGNPIKIMSDFFIRFSESGELTLTDADIKNVADNAHSTDEIGACIRSAASLHSRIEDLNEKLSHLSEGDLTVEMKILSDKDSLGMTFAKTLHSLNSMFNEIRIAAEQVSMGAEQIAQGAQSLASGSNQQSASIEQFSSNLEVLRHKTSLTAKHSEEARDRNQSAGVMLKESMSSMSQVTSAMKSIDQSSRSITKIIKVIDDIAFQTNILALNAAVEAARAGQHGKGFAVVAEEVRNLANKSAEAAKETASLIEGSSNSVKEGNEVVENTYNGLSQVASNASEAIALLNEVAKDSLEQARSIESISGEINEISSVVQANSATAQESAAASEEIAAQAAALREVLQHFKINNI